MHFYFFIKRDNIKKTINLWKGLFMLSINISGTEIKSFMNKLLKTDCFDRFDIRNFELDTFISYTINGKLNNDYTEEEKNKQYCSWAELRPYVFGLIKGKIKPKCIKAVFSLNTDETSEICDNAAAMFLNIIFREDSIYCTTATAQKNFSLEKKEDYIWEEYIKKFFKEKEIFYTAK